LNQAISKWQEALPIFQALGERKTQVITLHYLGFVHRELGKPQQALNYLNDALSICRNVKDRLGEVGTLKSLGDVYRDTGDVQQALNYLNDALSICRWEGNQKREAEILNNLAVVYMDMRDIQQAIAYYNHARSIFQNLNDLTGEAVTLNNLGNVYRELGRLEKAMEDLNKALSICREENYRGGEATALNNLAAVWSDMKETQKALDYLNQALTICRDIGARAGQAETLHNLGFIYRDIGKLQKARNHLNQALDLYRAMNNRAREANTLDNLAIVYDKWGNPQQALVYLNQALPICREVKDIAGEANTLSNIAGIQYRAKNLQEALSKIDRAIGLLEHIRHNIVSPELKTSYFSTIEGHYKFKTTILMQLHQRNPTEGNDIKAFENCEKSKARGLLDLLTEAKIDISDGVLPELIQKKHSLEQELKSQEQRHVEIESKDDSNTEQQTAEINKRIKEILTSLEFIKSEILIINNPHPDIKSKPLTLQQIQKEILDENTVLLQYSLGEEESYLWVVTTEDFNSVELLSVKSINELALEFYHFLSNEKKEENPDIYSRGMLGTVKTTDEDDSSSNISDNDSRTIVAQIAQKLSQILLGEIAQKLNKKRRIVVVGDGSLHYIPFAALPNPSNLDINNLTPLIKDYEVINLPSSSTLATLRKHCQEHPRSTKKIAVLADPVFDIDDDRVKNKQTNNNPESTFDVNRTLLQTAARNVNRDSWNRLLGTRKEAKAILKLISKSEQISAISAFDFAANRNWLTSPQLADYSIVHLATHGCADSINPELSGLILSLVDEQGNHQNGYFRLHDVFNLNLSAELVVLSACQTGLGENIRGEGVVGLTRGFMYAGTPRVLVSLWNVDDSATAEMMKRFYCFMLEEDLTPAEALRAAQIEMQETKWKSPYYWAAFTLQGEWK
ncbi:MAG: CHAT domain-containing protein, partial [Xenococcus sp. (in: cyanobacteria)]